MAELTGKQKQELRVAQLESKRKKAAEIEQPTIKAEDIQQPDATVVETPEIKTTEPTKQPSLLEQAKASPRYQELIDKGYSADMIDQAISSYKPPVKEEKVVEKQQEPAVAPVEKTVEEQPKQEVVVDTTEEKKVDEMTPLAPLELSEYEDNSTVRQNEIVANLNQYRQTNPEYMKNIDTFRKTFSYGLRSEQQKELLDNWYQGYTKGVQLNNTPTNSLFSQYTQGTISNNDLEQLKLNNPAKYNEVMEMVDKQSTLNKYKDELYGIETETIEMAQPIEDETPTEPTIFEEYKNAINSEEIQTLSSELADKGGEIEQLQLQLTQIKDDVEKEYAGTGATKSKISAIIADRQQPINNKISALSIDYNTTLGKYNSLMTTAKDSYNIALAEKQQEITERNQKMQELGFYYQYDPEGIQKQALAKYNAENPDMDSDDYQVSKMALNNSLNKYYEDYGMIIQRPQAQVVADVMALAKKEGISVSEALKKNFIDPLQGKEEYQAILNKALGIEDVATSWKITTDEDGNTIVVMEGQGDLPEDVQRQQRIQEYTSMLSSAVSTGDLNVIGETVQNVFENGTYGGQCGYAMNDLSDAMGSDIHFGSSLESKIKPQGTYTKSNIPEVGSFVVLSSETQPNSGHVGMVTAIEDGKITVKSSNYNNDEKRRTDTISINNPAVQTYIKPEIKQEESIVIEPLSDDQRVVFNNQLSSFRGNPQVKFFEDGMQQYYNIQSSLDDVSGPGDVAAIFQFMKSLDPNSVVRESEFQVAAQSAGVAAYIGNTYDRLAKGEKLTESQREAFGKLARQFIINRGKSYDRLYDDMVRVTDNMKIDRSYLPTRATEQLYGDIEEQNNNGINFDFGDTDIGGGINSFLNNLY